MVATVSPVAGGEAAGHEATAQESTTSTTTTATQGEDSTAGESGVQRAPALPGAPAISPGDRVYTADQSSNTVTVIDPSANDNEGEVLGTISLGQPRLDGVLGPVDRNQVNTHGLAETAVPIVIKRPGREQLPRANRAAHEETRPSIL